MSCHQRSVDFCNARFDAVGARLTSYLAAQKDGGYVELTLGPLDAGQEQDDWEYFGSIIGPVAGRISNASFRLDNEIFYLEANHGSNLLHGGSAGFSNRRWNTDPDPDMSASRSRFTLESADLDQGFPGNVGVVAEFRWESDSWLELEITAQTSRPTPLNITQHIYWNLGGPDAETIFDHLLQVHADSYLPVHEDLLPTGELRSVGQTPFDFRSPRKIGECLAHHDPQIAIAKGLDHCWALNGTGFREVAKLSEPDSGLQMAIWTDQLGLQIYTANHLGEGKIGKGGRSYLKHAGIAFETQGFPDALNHPHFPSIIVRPGEVYRNRTRFVFTRE
jgi:aldose 1-epimerase